MVSAALEFKCLVDNVFSTYIDSIFGYSKLLETIAISQKENVQQLEATDPTKANLQFLDNQEMCYSLLESKLVRGTAGQFKNRNRLNSSNWQWAARMFIVTIYELWDGEYRDKIGSQKGLSKGQLILPIMGDIRLLRHWIIHSKSVPNEIVEKMTEIDWCVNGEQLIFNLKNLNDIVLNLYEALESI